MIKSAKDAREIIKFQQSDSLNKSLGTVAESLYAEGYIAALEGPEVRALVDALISFGGGAKIRLEEGDEPYLRWMLELSEKTLAQYREAIKK